MIGHETRQANYLVDIRTEELLALELDVGNVSRLRTIDTDFAAEFDPRYG